MQSNSDNHTQFRKCLKRTEFISLVMPRNMREKLKIECNVDFFFYLSLKCKINKKRSLKFFFLGNKKNWNNILIVHSEIKGIFRRKNKKAGIQIDQCDFKTEYKSSQWNGLCILHTQLHKHISQYAKKNVFCIHYCNMFTVRTMCKDYLFLLLS